MTEMKINHEELNLDEFYQSRMEQAAPTYDTYMKWITLGSEHRLREKTVKAAGVKTGDRILEVGCGTGTLTLEARRQAGPSGSAHGIDVIPLMIELSQKKAARFGSDVSFQVGSMDEIPFPDNQFDVVMGSFMIFHMSETKRRKGIGEIYRVLKPGGRLFFLDGALPTQPFQKKILQGLMRYKLEHELSELKPLMEEIGFSKVELGTLDFKFVGFSMLGFIRGCATKVRTL